MNTYILDVIRKYKHRGLLIDTNIALLYIVGSLDSSEIREHGRTSKFTEDDFSRVGKFIEYFPVRITTPHVLTEISDLLGNRTEFHYLLRDFIIKSNEIYENSGLLSKAHGFLEIGLADAAIINAAKDNYLIFTDDGPLQGFLGKAGFDFVNLEQIRMI